MSDRDPTPDASVGQHTPEPWSVREPNGYSGTSLRGELVFATWGLSPFRRADAARIVACINALAGIADPPAMMSAVYSLARDSLEADEAIDHDGDGYAGVIRGRWAALRASLPPLDINGEPVAPAPDAQAQGGETLYRIKPLEWKRHGESWLADPYYVWKSEWSDWRWSTRTDTSSAETEAAAKAAAEEHYRSRLLSALEPVTVPAAQGQDAECDRLQNQLDKASDGCTLLSSEVAELQQERESFAAENAALREACDTVRRRLVDVVAHGGTMQDFLAAGSMREILTVLAATPPAHVPEQEAPQHPKNAAIPKEPQ